MGFVDRNRIRATMSLDLPFSRDTDGWLRYLCSLSPIDWRSEERRVGKEC